MARANRICKICGKKYYFCPSCTNDSRPSWYGMFHDENCKNIFCILTNAFLEKITPAAAKKQLESCDLSNIASFQPSMQEQIRKIMNRPFMG